MFRGLCGRQQPFMMAETGCFSSASDSPRTFDALKAWFWDAKLHGCGDHLFFRWRESVNGEEDHPAILPWSGKPGVGYETVKRIKEEFDRVALDLTMPATPPRALRNTPISPRSSKSARESCPSRQADAPTS